MFTIYISCRKVLTNRNPVGIIIKNGSGEYPRCRARFSQCNIFLIFPETEVLLSSDWPQLSSVCQHTRNADTRWSSMMLYSAQPSYHGRKERWQWTIKTNPLPEMLPVRRGGLHRYNAAKNRTDSGEVQGSHDRSRHCGISTGGITWLTCLLR